jgi:hypothetical protein
MTMTFYGRPLALTGLSATTQFCGSTAGGALLSATNPQRLQLTVQPLTDAFRVGPIGSLTASSGLLIASGVVQELPYHNGGLFANPNGGATAAIAVWESSTLGF